MTPGPTVTPPPGRQVPPSPFLWQQANGKMVAPSEMVTSHLFYAARMLWNHSVPRPLLLRPMIPYRDIAHWSPEYRAAAFDALMTELEGRGLLPQEAADVRHMAANRAAFGLSDCLLAQRNTSTIST